MVRQGREHLAAHDPGGLLGRRQDVDQHVDLGQRARHGLLRDDLDAGTGAGAPRGPPHLGAEGLQRRGEGLPDLAEAPDQHPRSEEGGEPPLGPQRLQPAQLRGPLVALLRLPALRQAPHQAQQQRERVLADGQRVQAGTGRDHHLRSEARGEDAVHPGGQRLDASQAEEVLGRGGEVAARGAPHHQHLGVVVLGGDLLAGVDDDRLPSLGELGVQVNGVGQQDLHDPRVRISAVDRPGRSDTLPACAQAPPAPPPDQRAGAVVSPPRCAP